MPEQDDQPITKGDLKLINYQLSELKTGIESIQKQMRDDAAIYLTKETFNTFKSQEFDPIKKILFKVNWLVISTVVIALLSLIIVGASKLAN